MLFVDIWGMWFGYKCQPNWHNSMENDWILVPLGTVSGTARDP